jgi:hypothetical protein
VASTLIGSPVTVSMVVPRPVRYVSWGSSSIVPVGSMVRGMGVAPETLGW